MPSPADEDIPPDPLVGGDFAGDIAVPGVRRLMGTFGHGQGFPELQRRERGNERTASDHHRLIQPPNRLRACEPWQQRSRTPCTEGIEN